MSVAPRTLREEAFLADAIVLSKGERKAEDRANPPWLSSSLAELLQRAESALVVPLNAQSSTPNPSVTMPGVPTSEVNCGAPAAVLSLPFFRGTERSATLVIAANYSGGTVEVWGSGDERLEDDDLELRLETGYFGVEDSFRRVTAVTKFRRGLGLPGSVWAELQPILFHDLSIRRSFLRAEAAISAGLAFGLGIPVTTPVGSRAVVFLSTRSRPFARSICLFRSDEALELIDSFTLESNPEFRRDQLERSRQMAAATIESMRPLATPSPQNFGLFAFTWPSVDATGRRYVTTVMG